MNDARFDFMGKLEKHAKERNWIDKDMIVCDECGNKRCPHATNIDYICTNSNQPGQEGSIYTKSGIVEKQA